MLPAREHGMAVGFLGGALLLMNLLGAAADPVYPFLNYWGMAGGLLVRAVLLLLLGLAIERLAQQKRK